VRVALATGNETLGTTGSGGPVQESDVVGLVADLSARPLKGAAMAAGRVAFVNALGSLDSVTGNASDCVRVDGSSGPCGTGTASFVDGDSPAGIVDGSNLVFTLSATPNPSTSLSVYRNGMRLKPGQDYNATANSVHFVTTATPQPGDTLLASYRLGGDTGTVPQVYPGPQILCSGTGLSTTLSTLGSLGACAIPGGLLAAGDRVEIRFDLAHTGATSGFSFEADWGATPVVTRTAGNLDASVAVRADAAITSAGALLSEQSWGTVMPFTAVVVNSADAYTSGLTINFQGRLSQAGDTLALAQYSVVRLQ